MTRNSDMLCSMVVVLVAIVMILLGGIIISRVFALGGVSRCYNSGAGWSEAFTNALNGSAKSPCNDVLTDKEYLVHMIPHHMVAVDVSYMLQRTSRNSVMQDILRNLIWMQEYEVTMMNATLQQLVPEIRLDTAKTETLYNTINRRYISTVANFTAPNTLGYTKAFCDPNFFDVDAHRQHIRHMDHQMDEIMYIKHMIPHHQVAVDMSKRLLKHTRNPFMMELAYRIIRNQEREIVFLDDMLNDHSWLVRNNSYILL